MDVTGAMRIAKDVEASPEQLLSAAAQGEKVDRLLARHAKASAELLEALSHSSDKATRKAVVLNAGASKVVLLRLAPQFPGDFFKNPAFDWMLLEDPELLVTMGKGVLKNILKRADCPASFMNWAVARGTDQEKLAVAMNPLAPLAALQTLVNGGGEVASAAQSHGKLQDSTAQLDPKICLRDAVKSALSELPLDDAGLSWKRGYIGPAQWPYLSPLARLKVLGLSQSVLLDQWLPQGSDFLAGTDNTDVALALAEHRLTPASLRRELARNPNVDVRYSLAVSEFTPTETLESLVTDVDSGVRQIVAEDSRISVATSAILCQDMDSMVRLSLARNPSLDVAALGKLTTDGEYRVRKEVAEHPKATAMLLEVLARDPDSDVRRAVARNPAASSSSLELLARDPDEGIRFSVAGNTAAPADLRLQTLEALARETGIYTQEVVKHHATPPVLRAEILATLAASTDRSARVFVAEHAEAPTASLELLARDPDANVAYAVAGHRNSPVNALELLSKHASKSVRWKVAGNRATPLSALQLLAQDSDREVRQAVARNADTPAAALAALALDEDASVRAAVAENSNTPGAMLLELSQDKGDYVVLSLASNLSTSDPTLWLLSKNPDKQVRKAVACNPAASRLLLESLANDTDVTVRFAVATNPVVPAELKWALIAAVIQDKSQESSLYWIRGWIEKLEQSPDTPSYLRVMIAKRRGQSPPMALRAASDTQTSAAELEKLALSKKSDLLKALFNNPATPESARVRVAQTLVAKECTGWLNASEDWGGVPWGVPAFILLEARARVWWHGMTLLAKRHKAINLPPKPRAEALVAMFQQEAEHLLRSPELSMASKMMGVERLELLTISPLSVEAACNRPLYEKTDSRRQLMPARLLGLSSSSAPIAALIKRYRSVDWVERLAVASNLNTPANLLKTLAKDAHQAVARQAVITEGVQAELARWQQEVLAIRDPWEQLVLTSQTNPHSMVTHSTDSRELLDNIAACTETVKAGRKKSQCVAPEESLVDDETPDEEPSASFDFPIFKVVDLFPDDWRRRRTTFQLVHR